MTTLIIPDIHTKIDKAQAILDKEEANVDHVVFLGDYFDAFRNNVGKHVATINWLIPYLNSDRYTCLIGNHEASYMHPRMRCAGWEPEYQVMWDTAVRDGSLNIKRFASHFVQDGMLMTHAGLAKGIVLDQQCTAIDHLRNGTGNTTRLACLDAHIRDGGNLSVAGILWNRPKYSELSDKFKFQIFGHTPCQSPAGDVNGSYLCIDTHLNHYVVLQTGDSTVISLRTA